MKSLFDISGKTAIVTGGSSGIGAMIARGFVENGVKTYISARKEERLKGVSHYMSPKTSVGNINFSLYHSGSVPLNVGLHQAHPFLKIL